jgi:parallel beta-helix repeat protein
MLNAQQPGAVRAAPAATIRYVSDNYGVDSGGCADSQSPCLTVQYALAQAGNGDTIRVANSYSPAVYAGTLEITESVTLEGGWAVVSSGLSKNWQRPSPCEAFRTILDGQFSGRVISITGNIAPTIDCFTIMRGSAEGLGGDPDGYDAGGGIYSRDAAPIITNNVITHNLGCNCVSNNGQGGGIYLLNAPSTAVISGNLIAYNVADDQAQGRGGGIMLRDSNAQVLTNTIEHNRGGDVNSDGGGIAIVGGTPTIADNRIESNRAGDAGPCSGGGIYVWSATPAMIERNLVRYNVAIFDSSGYSGTHSRGGGIYYAGSPTVQAIIRDNRITNNTTAMDDLDPCEGGGLYLHGLTASSIVEGNTIDNNRAAWMRKGSGGGIYVANSDVTINDNWLYYNTGSWAGDHGEGGGLYVSGGTVLLQSNVITNNSGAHFGSPSVAAGLGGGMVITGSTATVRDNWIVGNTATNGAGAGGGGGIYAVLSELVIDANTIAGNNSNTHPSSTSGAGGGLYLEANVAFTVTENHIYENTARQSGGGIACESCANATIIENEIYSNTAETKYGGGIALAYGDGATLSGNTVYGNDSGWGGGIYLLSCDYPMLARNWVLRNSATYGGGMYLFGEGGTPWTLSMENNVVADNQASTTGPGLYVKGITAHMLHTTVGRNTGGSGEGIYVTSGEAIMTNTVLVSQTVGIYISSDSTVTMEATLWGSGRWANGTTTAGGGYVDHGEIIIMGDPAFRDSWYHLGPGSEAIDAALDVGLPEDIDGDPRPIGPEPDIGADEAPRWAFLPLVMRNH